MQGTFGTPQALTPQQLILNALLQVTTVRIEMQGTLAGAPLNSTSVSINGGQRERWVSMLQQAINSLGMIAAPAIFPPPIFVTNINQATTLIQMVISALGNLPCTLIFPPSAATCSISKQTLQTSINELEQAEALLLLAFRSVG